jgi:hypothetical protein
MSIFGSQSKDRLPGCPTSTLSSLSGNLDFIQNMTGLVMKCLIRGLNGKDAGFGIYANITKVAKLGP